MSMLKQMSGSGVVVTQQSDCGPEVRSAPTSESVVLTTINRDNVSDNKRSRGWCYTLNDYTQAEYDHVLSLDTVYHVVGKEVGDEGTPHLQGYLYFKSMKSFKQTKAMVPRAHLEVAQGNSLQNRTYCTKGNDFVESGVRPMTKQEQGALGSAGGDAEQERWKAAKTAATEGRLDDVPDDIFVRYYRTLKNIREDYATQPDDLADVTCVWIHGPTGAGKSHLVREVWPDLYDKCCNKWWDGYVPGKVALLDDFDLTHECLGHHVKRWADKYAFRAEVKGGTVNLRPPVIAVTSQYLPMDVFKDDALCQAIQRRFKIITIRDVDDHYRAQGLQNLREWATLHDALQGPIHGEPVV